METIERTIERFGGMPESWARLDDQPKRGVELAEPDGKTADAISSIKFHRQRDKWLFIPWTSWGDEFGGFGVPLKLDAPPNRVAGLTFFDWLRRGAKHLILTGETGTGKTTTLCWLMRAYGNYMRLTYMRYCQFAELCAEYQTAKRNDWQMSEAAFWRNVGSLDVLAVDEIVNRRNSALSAELLYALLDRAYSGKIKRLWLAGNIGSHALDEMTDEPELMRRRLAEAFIGGRLERDGIRRLSFGGAK